jgi:hypothetical protein
VYPQKTAYAGYARPPRCFQQEERVPHSQICGDEPIRVAVSGVRPDGDQKRDALSFDAEMFGHRDQAAVPVVWCQAPGQIIKIRRFSLRSPAQLPLGAPMPARLTWVLEINCSP